MRVGLGVLCLALALVALTGHWYLVLPLILVAMAAALLGPSISRAMNQPGAARVVKPRKTEADLIREREEAEDRARERPWGE